MVNVGALVTYGSNGVCRVVGVEEKCFFQGEEKKRYYVLEPIDNKSCKLFAPVDNENTSKKMNVLLSYEEFTELVNNDLPKIEWISDNKQRNKYYKEIFNSYDRAMIVSLARRLYEIKSGKYPHINKLFATDEEALKKILDILYDELSHIMVITKEQVLPYICKEIECEKRI